MERPGDGIRGVLKVALVAPVRCGGAPRADIEDILGSLARLVFMGVPPDASLGALVSRLIGRLPLKRGDSRCPPIGAERSPGDCERRLPALEFDCTEEERRTPDTGRQDARHWVALSTPGSASLLRSSSSRSCCLSCSAVERIWLLIREYW